MARAAKRPERRKSAPAQLGARVAALVAANPQALAGGTAFAVALGFVSVNALWYQPHRHPSAFFATRAADAGPLDAGGAETALPPARAAERTPDPVLEHVQSALEELGFYRGAVDGLPGPATRQAIATFRQSAGLAPSGELDDTLLAAIEAARSAPEDEPAGIEDVLAETDGVATGAVAAGDGLDIRKLQAGLRAFGRDGVAVDGIMGARTREALREFQALFGLPETGEPSEEVFAKMREVGLLR